MDDLPQKFLILLVLASWVYWIVAWWWVRELVRTGSRANSQFTPPVSILKPVKGFDYEALANFTSFCEQDYPDYEILFGVVSASDPMIGAIRRIQQEYPERNIRLLITPPVCLNPKVSILAGLAGEAHSDILVTSDSDVRVTRDYLRRVVAPFVDENIGLVTCGYRGESPRTLTARLEALHMGATFFPSVVVARRFLGMQFALGATLAIRRSALARIGGFSAVGDFLADDFQIGMRVARSGYRVYLSDYIVQCVLGETSFSEQWHREVRWARCNRVSRPREYPGLILTFTTPLALLLLIVSQFSALSFCVLACSLLVRWLVGYCVLGLVGNRELRGWLIWLPIRDLLSALVWCVAAVGHQIEWRGEYYNVKSDGRLESGRISPTRLVQNEPATSPIESAESGSVTRF